MSEIFLSNQTEASTPSANEVVIYAKDNKICAKGSNGEEQNLSNESAASNVYKVGYTDSHYTMDLEVDGTIITHQTSDIVITVPLATSIPDDGHGREYAIINLGASGTVTLQMSGAEVMSNGLSSMRVNRKEKIRFAGVYPTLGMGWMRTGSLQRAGQFRIDTKWDATNFSGSWSSIPWDTEDVNDDPNIIGWSISSNQQRVYANADGKYSLSIFGTCNSTGGVAYTCNIRVRKNGSSTVDGSKHFCGNYQQEDSMLVISNLSLDLVSGDYVEVQLKHSNLTGEAMNFVINIQTVV